MTALFRSFSFHSGMQDLRATSGLDCITRESDGNMIQAATTVAATVPDLWKVILSFISGGLAGAVLNYFTSTHRQRVELVLKITDRYLDRYDEIGQVKSILRDSSQLASTVSQDAVRRLGDWFELIAVLYQMGYLSKRFLKKLGLLVDLREVHELITARKNEPNSPIREAWSWWPHFDALVHTRAVRRM